MAKDSMITLTIENILSLHPLQKIPMAVLSRIMGRLTFDNPRFLENEKRGFSTWGIPKHIKGYEMDEDSMTIPRGFTRQLIAILKDAGLQFTLYDRRRTLPDIEHLFNGKLKDFQDEAVRAVLSRDFGTLAAPTGSGKTVMALAAIAHRKQPALVLVHNKELPTSG